MSRISSPEQCKDEGLFCSATSIEGECGLDSEEEVSRENKNDSEHANISEVPARTVASSGMGWQEDDHHTSSSSLSSSNSSKHVTVVTRMVQRILQLWQNLTLAEVSGSFGDLGTLVPLLVTMARQRSLHLGPALFWAGIANVVTGYSWDIPMCVQPMKSIAAVALATGMSQTEVTTAGITVGVLVFGLGVTNAIDWVNKLVPFHVVSGIQIGVGLKLALKGMSMVQELPWWATYDSVLLATVLALLCMYWLQDITYRIDTPQTSTDKNKDGENDSDEEQEDNDNANKRGSREADEEAARDNKTMQLDDTPRNDERPQSWWKKLCSCLVRPLLPPSPSRQHPVGLYLFLLGAFFALLRLGERIPAPQISLPLLWALDGATAKDWKVGFLEGAIPQLPLTTLNSVISVCALAHTLYPHKRRRQQPSGHNSASAPEDAVLSRREVAMSVGLLNMLLCPFGSMPNCHGAGGLAGQHRLGARSGSSVVFLGLGKILLGILFGSAASLEILDAIPNAILGLMLVLAGQELTVTGICLLLAADTSATDRPKTALRTNVVIAVVTTVVTHATGKVHYGAGAGWVAHFIYGRGYLDLFSRRTSERQWTTREESRE